MELQITALKNGIVIDHIPVEKTFPIVEILRLREYGEVITVACNLKSSSLGKKGLIKSEKPLSDEAMKSLRRAWNRFYDENADNVVILNKVFYFAFDTKKITRGSLKERYEAYKLAIETGWLGINEIRKEEDYSSLEGLDIIKMNLANVFYDMKNQKIYTPNTGTIFDLNKNGEEVKE